MTHRRRVGVYLTTEAVLANPDYAALLRDRIGLNLAILSYSGAVSPSVARLSPFDGVPLSDACLRDVVIRHVDGESVDPREFDWVRQSCGPAVRVGGQDGPFEAALAILKGAGLEVWLCAGAWTERRLMFCPSHPGVNQWFEALYVDLAQRYGADGLDITHARYPMGSFARGLFACTCDRCAADARSRGYDHAAMVRSLADAATRLAQTDLSRLAVVADRGIGPFDFLQVLGLPLTLLQWFRWRCDLLADNLQRFRAAVRRAAGPQFVFGTDTHPASLSLFVGHDHTQFHCYSDFASPLVSHISAFVVDTLVVWARFLQALRPDLHEAEALRLVYRFLGYGQVGLADAVAALDPDHPASLAYRIPLPELVGCDLRKARALLSPELPSYPIIHGTGWPRGAIDTIVSEAEAFGHDGVIWQGTDELVDYRLR